MDFNLTSLLTATICICHTISSSIWEAPALIARVTQSTIMHHVSHIAQLDPTIMDKLALFVLLHSFGTELIVLIDVQVEKFGMSPHLHVFAQQDNHGMGMPALFAPTEKHGTAIQTNANVQLAQPGTE